MQNYFTTYKQWSDFDRDHLWHPYTSMKEALPCYPAEATKGALIHLSSGETLIDGMSSWWSALHGYNHPKLIQALVDQAARMPHIMFGGIAHQPAAELGRRLIEMTPDIFQHVFLADSGSISVEVAIKMALQYWQSKGQPEKQSLLTVRGGYHGDPFTCMSVSDPDNSRHDLFPRMIGQHYFAPRPQSRFDGEWDEGELGDLRDSLSQNHSSIAAIIIEPIVQGAGGMWFYHPQYLKALRALADEFDILLIFDEIATGFGRTGKLFAMEHAGMTPDILCLGKALSGGVMTLAATLTSRHVAMTISEGEVPVLMHGPTFMGNPLACSVACASLDVLMGREDKTYPLGWEEAVSGLATSLQALCELDDHPAVNDVRILGGIGVVEMHRPVDVARFQAECVKGGIWVRPFGRLIYIMPPYIVTPAQSAQLCRGIINAVHKLY